MGYLLERAEEEHMKSLLERIRHERQKAREEAEDRGLDEVEVDNLLWQRTHQNFRNVMGEMAMLTNRAMTLEENRAHFKRSKDDVASKLLQEVKDRPHNMRFDYEDDDSGDDQQQLARFQAMLLREYGPVAGTGGRESLSSRQTSATVPVRRRRATMTVGDDEPETPTGSAMDLPSANTHFYHRSASTGTNSMEALLDDHGTMQEMDLELGLAPVQEMSL